MKSINKVLWSSKVASCDVTKRAAIHASINDNSSSSSSKHTSHTHLSPLACLIGTYEVLKASSFNVTSEREAKTTSNDGQTDANCSSAQSFLSSLTQSSLFNSSSIICNNGGANKESISNDKGSKGSFDDYPLLPSCIRMDDTVSGLVKIINIDGKVHVIPGSYDDLANSLNDDSMKNSRGRSVN